MPELIAKFKCQGSCGLNLGITHEKGAHKCRECSKYFICLKCAKGHKYLKGKFGQCDYCSTKPKTCDQPGCMNLAPFKSCRDCYFKNSIVVLPDDEITPDTVEITE